MPKCVCALKVNTKKWRRWKWEKLSSLWWLYMMMCILLNFSTHSYFHILFFPSILILVVIKEPSKRRRTAVIIKPVYTSSSSSYYTQNHKEVRERIEIQQECKERTIFRKGWIERCKKRAFSIHLYKRQTQHWILYQFLQRTSTTNISRQSSSRLCHIQLLYESDWIISIPSLWVQVHPIFFLSDVKYEF